MAEAIPVLQIIHVSDLHFRHPDYSDLADLAREGRMVRLQIRKLIEKRDWFGWHEGTLDHDECADRAFLEFLRDLRAIDGIWFPDEDDKANPPTWLVDTGDGTASGDDASMRLVQDRLRDWEATLLGCQLRTLYGNHDAWPGIQPALRGGMDHRRLADVQRTRVEEWPCWRSEKWRDPFVAPLPNGGKIELYGLNTVSFDWWDNVRAVGRVDNEDLKRLRSERLAVPS